MYRLLVIDDEPFIVDWVYDLFHQHQELDLDIYKAYSGSEALSLLRRAKIDVVLTDIKMPDINGLDLLNEIKRSWPLCKVIFLTAHDEFEYAHIANKGGVTYLLKTESDEEIIKAVEKAINEIDNFIKQEELIKNARRQMEKTLPVMQREYLLEKIKTNESVNVPQQELDELNINLDADADLLLLIGRVDDWFLLKQTNDRAKQSAMLQTIVHRFFYPGLKYAFVQLDNSILVWLIQPQKDAGDALSPAALWDKTIVYVKGSLDSIQDQCKKSLETTGSFVLDSKPCPWRSLAQRFSSLLMLMNYGGINRRGMVLTKVYGADDGSEKPEEYGYCLRQVNVWLEKSRSLEAYLESGQRKEFFNLFTEIRDSLVPIIKMHSGLGTEVYYSISLMLLTYVNRYESIMEKLAAYSEFRSLMNINSSVTCEEVFENFQKIADMIFMHQVDEREKREHTLIATLHEYIQNNLNKDVSLVKLAELVFLNPAYLSRVYKNITETNLSDYIYNTRLNKAKKLLKESGMKVHEIADAVGFESVAYFIRSFKKSTGLTPQEYREKVIEPAHAQARPDQ